MNLGKKIRLEPCAKLCKHKCAKNILFWSTRVHDNDWIIKIRFLTPAKVLLFQSFHKYASKHLQK